MMSHLTHVASEMRLLEDAHDLGLAVALQVAGDRHDCADGKLHQWRRAARLTLKLRRSGPSSPPCLADLLLSRSLIYERG